MFRYEFQVLLSILLFTLVGGCHAETPDTEDISLQPMTNAGLESLIAKVDEEFSGRAGFWELVIEGVPVQVVTDENADRMRIIVPIVKTNDLTKDELFRLLQANFDSALDARYAIANGLVWGTFIHPLSTLSPRDFLMGLGQTVNVSITYGSTYTSGVMIFRGGDSDALQQKLMDRLKRLSDVI